MVRPSRPWRSRTPSPIWSHSAGRSPAITSSSSSRRGRVASARATSSRLRSGRVSEDAGNAALASRLSFFRMEWERARALAAVRSRRKAPTMTLSSTVRPAKGLTSWKVRPMPAAQTWSGRSPSMRFFSNTISPASGAYTPAMTLKMVVLPAPLGPISPLMLPSGISKEASCTARRPRKDFETCLTSSMDFQLPSNRRPDAVGQEHHHHQQDQSVEHLLDAGDLPAQRGERLGDAVGEQGQHGGAEDRPEEGADAADHRAEDQ